MPDHLPDCPCCGAALSPVDFAVRSTWPDALLTLPPAQREQTWGNQHLRAAEGLGEFVRCLMPVRLTGGSTVEYSVWLRVPPTMLRHAGQVWESPGYPHLRLTGTVANAIQPWTDLLGTPARAEVRDPESIPYLVADEGTLMHRVLHDEWDRDDVLSRLTHALPAPVRQPVTPHWSLERSAGLALLWHEDRMYFSAAGRTVHLEPLGAPAAAAPADVIRDLAAGAPHDRTGELTETTPDLHRYAFWRPALGNAGIVHNLHGYAVARGEVLHLVCVYDDPADLTWAQHVWRSVSPLQGDAPAPC